MIPGRRLLQLLLAWLALAIAAVAWEDMLVPWQVAGGVLVVVAILAALELVRLPDLEVTRRVADALPLGEWTDVSLTLTQQGRRAASLEVFDHYPTSAELRGLPILTTVSASGGVELAYQIRPRRRGNVFFGKTEILRRGTFDLLRRRQFLGEEKAVRVLPNFRPILHRGLAGTEERLAELGLHLQRRRGEGLEFQELRDFRQGDSLRQVDWKATARRGALIARQYEDERNQQVILLLDCGRRMHATELDLTHFDYVLNAALLLGYVAVRQGDAVGLQAFGGSSRWLPPVRGLGAVPRLLEALHDLQTSNLSPDYLTAAGYLLEKQRRRALVLLVTNLRDEDRDELLQAVQILRRKHLVLIASTRERALGRLRDQEVTSHARSLEVAAAHHYLDARQRAHDAVRSSGALLLDTEPQELPYALVARYLEIKRAGQL